MSRDMQIESNTLNCVPVNNNIRDSLRATDCQGKNNNMDVLGNNWTTYERHEPLKQ